MSLRLEGGSEELFDVGEEALAVDGSVEQARRFDAVVAQSGEEGRGLPVAVRDLGDEALPRWRPAVADGSCGLGQVSSMKTSREGSMSR